MGKHEKRGVCVWLFAEGKWSNGHPNGAYLFDDEDAAVAWQIQVLEGSGIIRRVGELWNFVDDSLAEPVDDEHIIDHWQHGLSVIEWFHVNDVFVQTNPPVDG